MRPTAQDSFQAIDGTFYQCSAEHGDYRGIAQDRVRRLISSCQDPCHQAGEGGDCALGHYAGLGVFACDLKQQIRLCAVHPDLAKFDDV